MFAFLGPGGGAGAVAKVMVSVRRRLHDSARFATMIRVFSSRLKWDSPANPMAVLLVEKRRAGVSVLDLTESNPTHAGFEYPGDEILAALADARALRYDPAPRGLPSAREAVSEYYARRGVAVDLSRILLTV